MYYKMFGPEGLQIVVRGRDQVSKAKKRGFEDPEKLPAGTREANDGSVSHGEVVTPDGECYGLVTSF